MTNYRRLTGWLIGAWFVFALAGSARHLFQNDAERVGVAVALAAGVPLVVFAVWFAASARFREFATSLNPRVMTALQTWRIVGFVFVLLEAHRLLPRMFAWPAGFGDMFIGTTAALVAWLLAEPRHRRAFIAWQLLGILDLVVAVGMGTTAGLVDPQGVSMLPMTVLPLSIVPTFLVPLFLIFHVICVAQARKWRAATTNSGRTVSPIGHAVI